MITSDIPFPPLHLRKSVGPIEDCFYDNPGGGLVFEREVPPENYRSVFDFGCGCGRVARQLLLQTETPVGSYLGVDLFLESVTWARENLTPANPVFRFSHHDVFNAQFNPSSSREFAPLDAGDAAFRPGIARSVYAHSRA